MSAGTRPARFIPYGGSSAQATIGRKRKPQMDKDYYSVDDIEEYHYDEDKELRTIKRQSELSELFEGRDLVSLTDYSVGIESGRIKPLRFPKHTMDNHLHPLIGDTPDHPLRSIRETIPPTSGSHDI